MKEIQACLKLMTKVSYVDNYVETVDYYQKESKNVKCVIFEKLENARENERIL